MNGWEFSRECALRAWGMASTASKVTGTLIGVAVSFVGFIWKPIEDPNMNFLIGVAPLVVFFTAVLFGLLKGAYQMLKESEARREILLMRNTELEGQLATLNSETSKRSEEASRRHSTELERARNADPVRNELRRHLNGVIREMEVFAEQIRAGNKEAVQEFATIESRTADYLEKNLPTHRRFREKYPFSEPQQPSHTIDPKKWIERCEYRLNCLREIVEDL